jgi:hypothetical protein
MQWVQAQAAVAVATPAVLVVAQVEATRVKCLAVVVANTSLEVETGLEHVLRHLVSLDLAVAFKL